MKTCEECGNDFEYDEGITYDSETFVCFECLNELETQAMNWEIKNE